MSNKSFNIPDNRGWYLNSERPLSKEKSLRSLFDNKYARVQVLLYRSYDRDVQLRDYDLAVYYLDGAIPIKGYTHWKPVLPPEEQ